MFVPCLNGFRNDESFMQEVTDCSPLVTIVIPVFNVEKYISQCLESVLAQSYENLDQNSAHLRPDSPVFI